MDLTPDDSSAAYTLTRYDPGQIFIDHTGHSDTLLLTPNAFQALDLPSPQAITPALIMDWQQQHQADGLVVGTGQTHVILPDIAAFCFEQRLGFECMSTHSASRIHSILMAEHRAFVMVLFP